MTQATALPRRDAWLIAAVAISVLLALPFLTVLWLALNPSDAVWSHLFTTALPRYLTNTLLLMALVGLGTAAVGMTTAWLMAFYRFPGRAFFEWALLAPLAAPAYITAYTMVEFLEYAGPVQTALRGVTGWNTARDYWFPEIRSLGGAAFVMTFAFYPYVHLLARVALNEQSVTAVEVARSLGSRPLGALLRVSLPLARPAVVAGTALALMETLGDFGTVDYFAVPTLTAGVFSIWFESFNPGGAAQIALVMLALIFGLLAIERASRRGARFHDPSSRHRPARGRRLEGTSAWLAVLACTLPVTLGFALPIGVLVWRSLGRATLDPGFLLAAGHTALLAAVAATVSTGLGLLLVFGARESRYSWPRHLSRVSALGYAVPGVVLAIGILAPLLALDHGLASLGLISELLLTSSALGILFAYTVRFLAIPYGAAESGFARVTPSMALAARTLGETRGGALRRVQLPLLRGTLLAAWLLVFVESVKELPATLVLRPFNYDTLATRVYTHASLEDLEHVAFDALAIVLVGLLPAILLLRSARQSGWGSENT